MGCACISMSQGADGVSFLWVLFVGYSVLPATPVYLQDLDNDQATNSQLVCVCTPVSNAKRRRNLSACVCAHLCLMLKGSATYQLSTSFSPSASLASHSCSPMEIFAALTLWLSTSPEP